jgi:hypothetical protein
LADSSTNFISVDGWRKEGFSIIPGIKIIKVIILTTIIIFAKTLIQI